jgi:Domain of unknown function (DU1801).
MAIEDTKSLRKFLSVFPRDQQQTALWLREFVWKLYPQCNELIYDNYNALAFGWSPTERQGHIFCSVAIGRTSHNIHFGFYWGSQISDPEKKLLGEGNQYRYVLVKSKTDFPKTYVKKLVNEAYANSLAKVKDKAELVKGRTIVKSISEKKRERLQKTSRKKR